MTEQTKENNLTELEHILSINCEMVVCECGLKEVVRVSIVNSDCKVKNLNTHVIVPCI